MTLVIQTPNTKSLLLELGASAVCADSSGAAFAFVSKAGAEGLFSQPNIKQLTTHGHFELIVGIDAVTNIDALDYLQALSKSEKGLKVRVFRHNFEGSIFHPKFCWFRYGEKLKLVTGSGNLTAAGLGISANLASNNWEAFSIQHLDDQESRQVISQWESWLDDSIKNNLLFPLDAPEVKVRAIENSRSWPRKAGTVRQTTSHSKTVSVEGSTYTSIVLIKEIAKGRLGQADFGKSVFQSF